MFDTAFHLLKKLEPPVRPTYAKSTSDPASRAALDAAPFADLLTLVADGSLSSERPVSIDFETTDQFDEQQLARLASAADLAESSGAHRALMLIDGRGVVLDVAERRLELELSGDMSTTVALDAAVYVVETGALDAGSVPWPGTGLIPPAVATQIERANRAHHAPGSDIAPQTETPFRRVAG